MLKKLSSLFTVVLFSAEVHTQIPDSLRTGIHQVESEYYSSVIKEVPEPFEKKAAFASSLKVKESGTLARIVLGWHPYWASSSAHEMYDYKVLSHIAYFSYEVDTATGGYTTIHSWNSTPVIDYAHQRGTRVLLTVTNFGSSRNTELLTDTSKQKVLINNVIFLLKSRNGDGVNFDLESVSSSQKINLVNFMQRAVSMIKAELPDAEISMATPAVDWSGAWNFKKLSEICDYLIVMGYDYYWSGSSTAGPVAPLSGENYNISKTVSTYLNAGVLPGKLALGVPWYGYDWPVANQTRKSVATGKATARIFSAAQQLAESNKKIFDQTTLVPWLNYISSGQFRQMWFDDTMSLAIKYRFVNSRNLAGIGIWALSYEGSRKEIWSTINHAFSMSEVYNNSIVNFYPNPVTGTSKIDFVLSERNKVSLKIFDLTGRERIIIFEEIRNQGFYSEDFNPADLETGIYLCVLKTGDSASTIKIIVLKK